MITVRPIRPDELLAFSTVGDHSAHSEDVLAYMEQMVNKGTMRIEWCFLAEKDGEILGRLAFWTLPTLAKPLDFVLLELPWTSEHCFSVGSCLLNESLRMARSLGVQSLGYVVDTPASSPQWQGFFEQRVQFLEQFGFTLERKTHRFEYTFPAENNSHPHRLTFRTLLDVGDDVFIDAIQRISANSLDQRTQSARQLAGAYAEAKQTFHDLQQMEYEPSWWKLAYTSENELVGLVMPTKSPTFATIGYIGVVPEQRGHGYIDVLLSEGMAILRNIGTRYIRADTDVHNEPMAKAFLRAGFSQFATRAEYRLTCKAANH